MIASYKVLNEDIIENNKAIEVCLNDDKVKRIISLENKKIYISLEYNTTIISIDSSRDEVTDFLELDESIFNENINVIDYNNTSIYILQYHKYDNDKKASASFGILKEIKDKFKIMNNCYKSVNYKGAPILQLSNKKKLIQIKNDDNDIITIE